MGIAIQEKDNDSRKRKGRLLVLQKYASVGEIAPHPHPFQAPTYADHCQ
jgi:hypothetical protein